MSSPAAPEEPAGSISRRKIILAIVGVVGFGVVLYLAGLDRLPVLLEADLAWIAGAFAALTAVTVVSTVRWGMIVDALAGRAVLPFGAYYAALLSSRVLGLFISRSGSDLGVRFAALTGARRAGAPVAAASVLLDQMFDLTLLVAVIGPSLLILTGTVSGPVGVLLLAVATVAAFGGMMGMHRLLAWGVGVLGWLLGVLARLPVAAPVQRFLAARRRSVARLVEVEGLSRGRLAGLGALTIVRYLLNAFVFYAVAAALGLEIGWPVFVLTGALVQLSLVIAATPGGLGVMDAGWVLALGLAGVASETTAVFLVGQRAFQYTGFPLLGAASSLLLARGRSRTPEGGQRYGDGMDEPRNQVVCPECGRVRLETPPGTTALPTIGMALKRSGAAGKCDCGKQPHERPDGLAHTPGDPAGPGTTEA